MDLQGFESRRPQTVQIQTKTVRILTPRTLPSDKSFFLAPSESSDANSMTSSNYERLSQFLSRILHFDDPAESLYYAGFIFGPQTWLIGGWYWQSVDRRDYKSALRLWVDKDTYNPHQSPDPHEAGSRRSSAVQSQVGGSPVWISALRVSRAVWNGRGRVRRRGTDIQSEISIDMDYSPWVDSCRRAAFLSGGALFILFVTSLCVIIIRW